MIIKRLPVVSYVLLFVSFSLSPSAAGQSQLEAPSSELHAASGDRLPVVDGPPPPLAPAVVSRDERGRVTVRAVQLAEPLQIDGRLDETIYETVLPISDFVQQVPREGALATEQTKLWVFFDDTNLYIVARCYDGKPELDGAPELRRDHGNIIRGSDNLTFVLDTFYDRHNGFFFQTNAGGALRDQLITDGQQNSSWNTVWNVRTARYPDGWSTELSIPFKSLRYRRPGQQVWGLNVRRLLPRKNELSTLSQLPASFGLGGISQMGYAATLTGIHTPSQSKNLELKPYGATTVTSDLAAAQPYRHDVSGDVGVDFKYGLTRGLILDATVNTDFAQVEEDVQQVNLTRFNLLFPEKRDFFLEGQGTFDFATLQTGIGGGVGFPNSSDVPVLFFSRQIGLSNGQAVPVVAGARLTGRAGRYDIGALNIQTADKPSARAVDTNFSVVRIKRNVLRQSTLGVIATQRLPHGGSRNVVVGADAALRPTPNLFVNAYYVGSSTPEVNGNESSYRGRFEYAADRYGAVFDHVVVGDGFTPGIGFVRRHDFRRSVAGLRFSPRPKRSALIRKLTWQATGEYVTSVTSRTVQDHKGAVNFAIELQNGDSTSIEYDLAYEFVPRAFQISARPAVVIPVGGYDSNLGRVVYTLGPQRRLSGTFAVSHGSFYGGNKSEMTYNGRVVLSSRVGLEPGVTLNWVDIPFGQFSSRLLNARVAVTPSPRLSVSGLIQANAAARTLSSSVRLMWEYIPGSQLFVVYSDGRDTAGAGVPALVNQTFAIKITRLLRQ